MKCPLCKRRKFDKRDEDYFENTGRCFKCDLEMHKEDLSRERLEKQNSKHPSNLEQHRKFRIENANIMDKKIKMFIKFEEVGRNKFNSTQNKEIKTESLQEAVESCEVEAFAEVQKHLMSGIVELVPKEEDYAEENIYDVCVGDFGRVVGRVIIGRIK